MNLFYLALPLALFPVVLFLLNLSLYSRLPERSLRGRSRPLPGVSVLVPARNEERNIESTLESVLANEDLEFEVIVLDDHSTDRTAALVQQISLSDSRVRLVKAPPLPSGWCGKQHACHVLSRAARYPMLLFLDADVRLNQSALARMAKFIQDRGCDLVSGVPHQETVTFSERLLLPLIHFLLLSYLPIGAMRRSKSPAFAAGCGQLFLVRAESYRQCGGHASIRSSLHDGLQLPRLFRRAGLQTDLFDATDVASCRMYRSNGEVWAGLAKNATEGLGSPRGILPWSVLLTGGQILPFVLVAAAALDGARLLSPTALAVIVYLPRVLALRRFRQSWLFAALHPFSIASLLGLQWFALIKRGLGKPARWKGRTYLPVSELSESRVEGVCRTTVRGAPARTLSLLTGILLCLPGSAADPTSSLPSKTIPSFELSDQYERLHAIRFPVSKVLVVAVADRKGNAQIDAWIRPVHDQYRDRIEIIGIADVSAVPTLLRGMVRKRFPKEREYPVMLDWEGKVARSFDYRKETANVFVLDATGGVIWQGAGHANDSGIKALLNAIESLVSRAPQSTARPSKPQTSDQ